MLRPFTLPLTIALMLGAAPFLSGCQDPCVTLAERICNCEPTPADRRTCKNDRIVNRQTQVQITEADRDFCEAQLEDCDCADVDENRLDQCGFVVEPVGTE